LLRFAVTETVLTLAVRVVERRGRAQARHEARAHLGVSGPSSAGFFISIVGALRNKSPIQKQSIIGLIVKVLVIFDPSHSYFKRRNGNADNIWPKTSEAGHERIMLIGQRTGIDGR
jgi:hypothetical protein